MTEKQKILKFRDSPDAGLPECICSLCGLVIPEEDVPVRVTNRADNWELRFHWDCYVKFGDIDDYELVMKED